MSRCGSADEPPTSRPSAAILAKPIDSIDFERAPLDRFLSALSEYAGVNVVVDWPALRQAKIAGDAPVTLKLKNVPLATALTAALHQAERSPAVLDFEVRDGVLYVSTEAALSRQTELRVYDCRAMLEAPLDDRVRQEVAGAVSQLWKERFAVFAPPWHSAPGRHGRVGPRRDIDEILADLHRWVTRQRFHDILAAVRGAVDPRSWDDRGGPGTIHVVGSALVVRQTARNHEAIQGLLAALRPIASKPGK
jgi:hypothetical protein